MRVKGEFPTEENDRVIAVHLVTDAEARWEDTEAEGPLQVGLDPARLGADDSGTALRRGFKVTKVTRRHGLDLRSPRRDEP